MPFALITLGLLMIVTGARNTHAQFGQQVANDVTGPRGFLVWLLAIGSVGALGYIKDLRQFSHYFLALILISMILSNKGFFQKFTEGFNAGPVAPTAAATPSISTPGTNGASTTVEQQQSGAFGQTPADPGQAKFNGWMNYFLGGSWSK